MEMGFVLIHAHAHTQAQSTDRASILYFSFFPFQSIHLHSTIPQ